MQIDIVTIISYNPHIMALPAETTQHTPLSSEVLFQEQQAKLFELAQMGKWRDITPLNFPVVHQINRDVIPFEREKAFDKRLEQIGTQYEQLTKFETLFLSDPQTFAQVNGDKQALHVELKELFQARYPHAEPKPMDEKLLLEYQIEEALKQLEQYKAWKTANLRQYFGFKESGQLGNDAKAETELDKIADVLILEVLEKIEILSNKRLTITKNVV